jgi:pyruvate/2-oxoacid:ferredoxin oxidoreductase alpha subunit
MQADLPEQEQVDRYLPPLDLAHRLRAGRPVLFGSITPPHDTQHHRRDLEAAMEAVPDVLAEAIDEFEAVFGRRPEGAFSRERTEDAETVLVASSTIARTARQVVEARRARGERVGLVRAKLFRPFLRSDLAQAAGRAARIAVLDRDLSPGSGGILWNEVATALRGRGDVVVQGYLVGLGGVDVTEDLIDGVLDDVVERDVSDAPLFFPRSAA